MISIRIWNRPVTCWTHVSPHGHTSASVCPTPRYPRYDSAVKAPGCRTIFCPLPARMIGNGVTTRRRSRHARSRDADLYLKNTIIRRKHENNIIREWNSRTISDEILFSSGFLSFHRGYYNPNVCEGGGGGEEGTRSIDAPVNGGHCNFGSAIEIYHARVADRTARTKANFEFERNIIICIRMNRKPAIVSLVQFDQP